MPGFCCDHVLVILTLLASCVLTAHAQSCTANRVSNCLDPLKNVSYDVSSAVVPFIEEAEMRDHCRRYRIFETCMEDVTPYCGTLDKLVFQGIEDAYAWLCKDDLSEYLKHRLCFNNTKLHLEGETCNKTLTNQLQTLADADETPSYKRQRICQYFDQYLGCIESVVTSFCNEEAAAWQRTLDVKSLNPTATQLGCPLENGSTSYLDFVKTPDVVFSTDWVPITIGVVLSLSILIIIVSAVLVCMQLRKRRLASNAQSQRVEGAPPPYEGPGSAYTVGYDGTAANVHGTAIQDKSNIDPTLLPPPYSQPNEYTTHALSPAVDDGVSAGYFGASASGFSEPVLDDKRALDNAEVAEIAGRLPEKNAMSPPEYEEASPEIGGFSNPSYEQDVEALGYFGSSPSKT